MLCVSGKISELGFSGARHRSGKVLKNGNAGTPRLWSPQPKRSRPQQPWSPVNSKHRRHGASWGRLLYF
jgi:hypothetical protein